MRTTHYFLFFRYYVFDLDVMRHYHVWTFVRFFLVPIDTIDYAMCLLTFGVSTRSNIIDHHAVFRSIGDHKLS